MYGCKCEVTCIFFVIGRILKQSHFQEGDIVEYSTAKKRISWLNINAHNVLGFSFREMKNHNLFGNDIDYRYIETQRNNNISFLPSLYNVIYYIILNMCMCPHSCAPLCDPQAPLPIEFSKQEYWSGVAISCSLDLPDSEIESTSLAPPASAGGFFTTSTTWEVCNYIYTHTHILYYIKVEEI